jgi:sulfide:quinone oxidoreductase
VYAVGDVTSAPVPRVGVIAEGEADTVADVLIHRLRGGDTPAPYQGIATCYVEFGGDEVAKFDVNFLGGPSPFGIFAEPSREMAEAKREFGAGRRRRWFG